MQHIPAREMCPATASGEKGCEQLSSRKSESLVPSLESRKSTSVLKDSLCQI